MLSDNFVLCSWDLAPDQNVKN